MNVNLNFFLGTAAELIKVYPVIQLALERDIGVRVISSGQSLENFEMQYRDLNLPEDNLLPLLKSSGDLQRTLGAIVWFARAVTVADFHKKLLRVSGMENYLVVHGDTLSTLAGAWLGSRAGMTVVHIEAGLRSPNLLHPFPEEITRRLVSRLARYHMAPDVHAEENLHLARVKGRIFNTHGNTLMDAVTQSVLFANSKVEGPKQPFALVNIHRFENLNSAKRWSIIMETLIQASKKIHLVFVAHPQTMHKLNKNPKMLSQLRRYQIEIRDRMPFTEFIGLLKKSEYLISDGGSNQEECSYLGKPCLLLRESTERQEGLDSCCVLSGFNQQLIRNFIEDPMQYKSRMLPAAGSPSQVIINALLRKL